ncbi:MAG: hypothetical protein JNM72_13825, partial [Deltaproteobacteria bacterium]|nr:hypothetical protein [Deltaproteobacteria bacterium]
DGKRAADRTDDAKAPRGARSVEGWSPRLEPVRGRRGAGEGATDPDDARLLPVGGWTRNLDTEEAPEARELKPSRAQRAALAAAGLHHDPGAGTFFGVTTTAIDDFPAGSLIFSEPEDGAGFAIAKAELAPAGGGKARKARAADQARADAAVGALSDSSPARTPSPGQEATTAAQIEAAAEVLAETPVGPEGESGAAGVSFAAWQDIERALVNLLDAPEKSTQHRVGRALEAWRDGLAPEAESAHAKPSPGNRGWAVLSLADLRAELDRVLETSVDDDDTDKQTRAYMAQVLSGFEAVTPPFAAAFALVAAARKHIANPKCKDEAREQSRAALAKAVDTLEAAATRRRAGGLPADQLAALRASARSVALTAAKLARSCAAGQLAMPSAKAESGAQGGKDSGGDPYATPRVRYIGARKVTVQTAGRGKDALNIDTGKWSWTVERTHPIVEKLRAAPLPPLPMPRKPDGWTKTEWQGWAGELGRALGLGPGEFDVQWLPAEGVSKEGWQLVIPRGHAQHGRSAVELTFELALNQLMFVGVVEAPVIQKGDVVSYIKGRTPVV